MYNASFLRDRCCHALPGMWCVPLLLWQARRVGALMLLIPARQVVCALAALASKTSRGTHAADPSQAGGVCPCCFGKQDK